MDYLDHITTEGERWDQLADRFYGRFDGDPDAPYRYEPIIRANLHLGLSFIAQNPVLPGGLRLRIPILEADDAGAGRFVFEPWSVQ